MFSISRSRYTSPVQFLFLATNTVGVLLVVVYNASTPDLYPNNAHHKIGWILTWVMSAQVLTGVISACKKRKDSGQYEQLRIPISTEAMEEHQRVHDLSQGEALRFSNDSGQGTEPNTESLRSQSVSSQGSGSDHQIPDARQYDEEDQHEEKTGLLQGNKLDRYLSRTLPRLLSTRVLRVVQFFYDVVDRVMPLLGFLGLATGFITYGGLFVSSVPELRKFELTHIRASTNSSVGLPISSKVECFSGTEF